MSAGPDPDAVLGDLVDAALQEGLVHAVAPDASGWGRVGPLRARLRPGGALQPWRLDATGEQPGPLRLDDGAVVAPGEAVAALGLDGPGAAALASDVALAVVHAGVLRDGRAALGTPSLDLLTGERLAATRGRPFHPTGRAVSGFTAADLRAYGPLRTDPVPLAAVAVRRDRLRHGPDPASRRLHEHLGAPREVGDVELLPAHPWQVAHVLPRVFADEIARGEVVLLADPVAHAHPTASIRTLALDAARHVKLPLGAATLGATRLLPPRYLDNADRAQRLARAVVDADPLLRVRVALADEGCWAGWSHGDDEFDDRPGHLAAQIRTYPPAPPGTVTLPMAALGSDEWTLLGPGLGIDDPEAFFAGLAHAFVDVLVGFLAAGVLPEVHGQNVVVHLLPGGDVAGFVLRDHDTLRVHRPWAPADPGYRIRPGARQSLLLDRPEELIGYAQTLGLQVALHGIADALARHHDLDERVLWAAVRTAVERALARPGLPPQIATTLLTDDRWPSRTVLGPLLATGPSPGVSMPAGHGTAPNPLLTPRDRARHAARERLLNCLVREVGPPVAAPGPVRLTDDLVVELRHHSPSGHHRWGPVADHDDAVDAVLRCAGADDRLAVEVARDVAVSVEHTARALAGSPSPEPPDPRGRTRHAEQAVRLGHPFHPTPKSVTGLDPGPGAFRLHWLAVDPGVVAGAVVDPTARWFPGDVVAAVPAGMLALPVHPRQAGHLSTLEPISALHRDGRLIDLGPLGNEVYATSSLRTVCDPTFPTAWKLPLAARITNFVRTVPTEHALRAADASRVVRALRPAQGHEGFGVLVETGWRGIDPAVVSEGVAEHLTVLFRENPFGDGSAAPRVLAALVEPGPRGEEPPLVGEVRRSGLGAAAWLRAHLALTLRPLLAAFTDHGVGFEAHLQNSLLETRDGVPARFWVRDMEGVHVSRERRPAGLAPDSPVVYDEDEAWLRLRYHAVVNHLATVVAVLGQHMTADTKRSGAGASTADTKRSGAGASTADTKRSGAGASTADTKRSGAGASTAERALWRVVAEWLGDEPGPYAHDLQTSATLPAKANLRSRLAGRGERPLYVAMPNPIREALR